MSVSKRMMDLMVESMLNLDVVIDTDLRERAISAVEKYIADYQPYRDPRDPVVSRSQVTGLMQIALNEPGKLGQFAGKQKQRAEDRAEGRGEGDQKKKLLDQAAFWELVRTLCEGLGARCLWSLLQAKKAAIPLALILEKLPPGTALSSEDRAKRERKKGELEAWEREWDHDYVPGFFRHFCADYMHKMPHQNH